MFVGWLLFLSELFVFFQKRAAAQVTKLFSRTECFLPPPLSEGRTPESRSLACAPASNARLWSRKGAKTALLSPLSVSRMIYEGEAPRGAPGLFYYIDRVLLLAPAPLYPPSFKSPGSSFFIRRPPAVRRR
ncbi:hypothetical protein CDAR_448841 [Caerostris darwini]|uniref:Secreted protein n=1 Tax=Caerostris darwini TaxID=1538125 RepID=A0AAV4WBV3_9ARAC|nr:hypothetical protein CDAR_448841 [Caerostris darwini]